MKRKEKETKVVAQVVLSAITKRADPKFKRLKQLKKINSQDDFNTAGAMVKALKEAKSIAEEEEQRIVGPLKDTIVRIQELFQPFYDKVDEEEARIKDQIKLFAASRRAAINKLEERVASGKLKDISKYAAKVAELTIENGDASLRNRWVAEIKNEKQIPREFLMPDSKKITEHLRKGGKPIPGVEWKPHTIITNTCAAISINFFIQA